MISVKIFAKIHNNLIHTIAKIVPKLHVAY